MTSRTWLVESHWNREASPNICQPSAVGLAGEIFGDGGGVDGGDEERASEGEQTETDFFHELIFQCSASKDAEGFID